MHFKFIASHRFGSSCLRCAPIQVCNLDLARAHMFQKDDLIRYSTPKNPPRSAQYQPRQRYVSCVQHPPRPSHKRRVRPTSFHIAALTSLCPTVAHGPETERLLIQWREGDVKPRNGAKEARIGAPMSLSVTTSLHSTRTTAVEVPLMENRAKSSGFPLPYSCSCNTGLFWLAIGPQVLVNLLGVNMLLLPCCSICPIKTRRAYDACGKHNGPYHISLPSGSTLATLLAKG